MFCASQPHFDEQCINRLKDAFPWTLERHYIRSHVNETHKTEVINMFNEIKLTVIDSISKLNWLGETEKPFLQDKVSKLSIFALYSNQNASQQKENLSTVFQYPIREDNYYTNEFYIRRAKYIDTLKTQLHKYNPSPLELPIFTTRAYYNMNANRVYVNAGVLQPPLYYENGSLASKFGALGWIISHEIMHGIGIQGVLFDSAGTSLTGLTGLMLSSVIETKTSCIIDQYRLYEFTDYKALQTDTRDEILADIGGLKASYYTYRRLYEKYSNSVNQNYNLSLISDQLFFLSFAQSLCGHHSGTSLLIHSIVVPHVIERYRVFGALINSKEFAHAYGCPQNAEKLENDLQALNVELEVTVNKFSESCDKLAACKLTLDHVNQCIEAIQISLPILEQYSRIEQSIADGRYYHALKNLEDLEHSQLDLIRPFAFSEIIIHRIPKTRTRIKNASLDELTDFLEYIRKNSIVLGAFAMREAAQVSGIDSEALCDTLAVNGYKEAQDVSKKPNNESQQQVMLKSLVHKASVNTNTDSLDNELEMLTQIVTNKNHPWITNDDHGEPEMTIKTQINVNNDDNCCNRTYSKVEDLVDFGPVYRCLHIHSVLNERAEFERHYCTQRRKQCQLILSLSPNQQVEMRNYGEFFSGICGFFVVDDFIRHTLSGSSVFYQTYLDELWVHTVNRLIDFVHVNAKSCDSPNDLIKLKDYLIIFERTMQNLGFPITGLTETIGIVQRYYHRLLASQWKSKFEAIIAEDSYETIKISNSEQLAEFLEMYPPGDTVEFSELPFPKQLCFSWMVPKIYQTVREYINLCYRFCENMDLAYTELEDTINRATNFLFSQCLNTVLTSGVRSSLRQLPRLTQFCINLDELETVCGHLDNYLQYTLLDEASSITSGRLKDFAMIRDNQREDPDMTTSVTLNSGANPPRSRLQGASLLKDIRVLVEDQICNHLKDNVAKFINLSNYDDTDDNNSGQTNNNTNKNDQLLNNSQNVDGRNGVSYITNTKIKPTENIVHLTSWLKSVFDSFSNLPPKIAQTACISVCKHIARLLYDVLFGSQVRSLSETGLQQLSIDLSLCESFARSQPVPGLDRTTLWLIFADLRQLLDLYHKDDWNSYIAFRKNVTGSGKYGSAYDRVPPSVAIKLLERLRDSDKKRTGFLQAMRKEERGRKKKLEDIIRQLRELNVTPRNN
ncbi:unnamed protein product [Schistosoma bovis]|nr:unnamed protein product [Schistosoma bovis]